MLGQLYELARADFVQRTRNSRYVMVLAVVVAAGYVVSDGGFEVIFGDGYAAVHNSIWLGGVGAMAASTMMLFVGFFVVKGTLERDRRLGVGELIASSSVSTPVYLASRWLSNTMYLFVLLVVLWGSMVATFVAAGNGIPDLLPVVVPFIVIAGPTTVVVASLALLFETVRSLRGSVGNFIFFFGAVSLISAALVVDSAIVDPIGFTVVAPSMKSALLAEYPNYSGRNIRFTFTQTETNHLFTWDGVNWGRDLLLKRLLVTVASIGFLAVSVVPFDRFDPSTRGLVAVILEAGPGETDEEDGSDAELGNVEPSAPVTRPEISLTPVTDSSTAFSLRHILGSEIRLATVGRSWWWYLGAAVITLGGAIASPSAARGIVAPIGLIWGFTIVSASGVRDKRHETSEFVLSSRYPVLQLVGIWVASSLVLLGLLAGVIATLLLSGGLLQSAAVVAGALFVPSLSLVSGVLTGTARTFELLYLSVWYAGTLNGYPLADFIGTTDTAIEAGTPWMFGLLGVVFLVTALGVRYRRAYR